MRGGSRCCVAVALWVGCHPSAPDVQPGPVGDGPLTRNECARFAVLRAEDPNETRSVEAYTQECLDTTAADPPWLRRTTRCLISAPTQADRKACSSEELSAERQAADAKFEAQLRQAKARERERKLYEAEQILREIRAQERAGSTGEPPSP